MEPRARTRPGWQYPIDSGGAAQIRVEFALDGIQYTSLAVHAALFSRFPLFGNFDSPFVWSDWDVGRTGSVLVRVSTLRVRPVD
jgi:hypothetical protein